MKTWIFAIPASLALVAAGLVHGYWTDRWATSADTQEAARRLTAIPLRLGEWEGLEVELKPGQAGPGVAGCVQRTYVNRRLNATVVLSVVCGRPGPVATHTPEVCYGASGFLVGQRREVTLESGGRPERFWTSDAVRERVSEATRLRLYWAWNGGEGWTASPDARQQFPRHRYPVLHKIYVQRQLEGPGEARDKDEACEHFLRELLPEMKKALFQGP
jgi:hypothetical protein